jgi:hypothetical protein
VCSSALSARPRPPSAPRRQRLSQRRPPQSAHTPRARQPPFALVVPPRINPSFHRQRGPACEGHCKKKNNNNNVVTRHLYICYSLNTSLIMYELDWIPLYIMLDKTEQFNSRNML